MDDEDIAAVCAWGFVADQSVVYFAWLCAASNYFIRGVLRVGERGRMAYRLGRGKVDGIRAVAGLGV